MFEPTANDLIGIANESITAQDEKVKSRFTVIMATSKRARELVENKDERVIGDGAKNPITVAVEEFEGKTVKIVKENEA
ncbi:MAG: DNA-directed RNA polymerase subunit omega [Lachnospiraceae bacterium]|nr:DNA-directed RNA polymerase subunit omega [Lachnospiraceae bacterium]